MRCVESYQDYRGNKTRCTSAPETTQQEWIHRHIAELSPLSSPILLNCLPLAAQYIAELSPLGSPILQNCLL